MSWSVEMVRIVRGLINDFGSPPSYSDERLQELLCTGAVLVLSEVAFSTAYTVSLSNFTISPAPSSDIDFQALVSLKTACIISMGEHRHAAMRSITIKDGPSQIDNRDVAKHLLGLTKGVCDAYEKAKMNYLFGDGSVGRAIVGPYGVGMGQAETYRG